MSEPEPQIFLSPPHVGPDERASLLAAFDSNWIAPVGPDLTAFEQEFAKAVAMPFCAALSSGTAALHLILETLGIGRGDDVVCSSFTFAASANAVAYTGATPVFVDSDRSTWNLDPDALDVLLAERARVGRLPRAVLCVDLYGQCADYDAIGALCERYEIALVEDAAEALGAFGPGGLAAGSYGVASAFSFNGNKIITTSGGGMVASSDEALVRNVHHLATQARQPVSHYEHTEIGYNYRLSNLLAALGRAQLRGLPVKLVRRREINTRYRALLADLPGISFQPTPPWSVPNHWLTCIVLDPTTPEAPTPTVLEHALRARNIESRPLWKPMHQQPVFSTAEAVVTGVSDELFARGLCLPSGSNLTEADQDRVIEVLRDAWQH